MAERFTVDPSQSVIDLDALSLDGYSILRSDSARLQDDPELEVPVMAVSVQLSGGLGKITNEDGSITILDHVSSLELSSDFVGLTLDVATSLGRLLDRWHEANIPLRFLEFGDKAMLVEDENNVVVFPPGPRNVSGQVLGTAA